MLYLAGIVITIFLAVLLTGKKYKTTADGILIAWLLAVAFHLILYYLFISGNIYKYPDLLGINIPLPLVHGPFLFLYTAELTRQQSKNTIAWLLHFVPPIILYLAIVPFFSLSSTEKIRVYQNKGAGYETLMTISLFAIIISGITYVAASLYLLRRYRRSIKDEFSNIDKINLAWLRYLVYGIAAIWLGVILGNDTIVFGMVVVFVFLLGYFGIRQVGIFTTSAPRIHKLTIPTIDKTPNESDTVVYKEFLPVDGVEQTEASGIAPKIKYEKSGLDEEKADKIYNRLVDCMTNQKPFTDSDITLAGLARTLDVHPNHLSQVINSYEGKNFYDYINFHRVEEFKRLAPQPGKRNFTLLALAHECGFNSKTSFNRNFKKATAVSPSEYLQQLEISLK
ncbi:MAG TPA: helix-turn-helix domain-containing protein [Chitinophagaceae bacterium]|nr:helix-turn-helix domain-containing protein [Chitinophagaceae bacterium]